MLSKAVENQEKTERPTRREIREGYQLFSKRTVWCSQDHFFGGRAAMVEDVEERVMVEG